MTPGNRPERLYKAVSSLADSVVFDLEDSIPPDQKNQARQIVAQTLVNLSADQKEVCVRINGLDTPYGDEDIKQIPQQELADFLPLFRCNHGNRLLVLPMLPMPCGNESATEAPRAGRPLGPAFVDMSSPRSGVPPAGGEIELDGDHSKTTVVVVG